MVLVTDRVRRNDHAVEFDAGRIDHRTNTGA